MHPERHPDVNEPRRPTRPPRRRAGGFTLIEMLVVIGIIVVLLGIAIPAINRAYRNGVRARMAADIQTLASGLDAYRADFKDYPRLDGTVAASSPQGACLLAWALLAPGPVHEDGADGPGFRTRIQGQGQVYGPYVDPSRFKISLAGNPTSPATSSVNTTINDRYGHAYLYFPAFKGANISANGGYVAAWSVGQTPRPMFNYNDNAGSTPTYTIEDMRKMLGDVNVNGILDAGETPAYTGPYLLWGAGPDEIYGYDPNNNNRIDDVTNFGFQSQ